jgi:hypothetical protein
MITDFANTYNCLLAACEHVLYGPFDRNGLLGSDRPLQTSEQKLTRPNPNPTIPGQTSRSLARSPDRVRASPITL